MSTDRSNPSLAYTLPFQLTKKIHRDVPPELSPGNPDISAKGKIIVITGGGSGIGAAAAKVWVQAGAEGVVIAGRRREALERVAAEIAGLSQGKTKILEVQTDITKEDDTNALFDQVKKTFGRTADVVLSNAGAPSPSVKPHEYPVSKWWQVQEVNFLGLHNMAMSFIKSQPNPNEPVGTFVSVNSAMAGMILPGYSTYSISKLAGQRYTEYLQVEYPTLRIFSLLPGIAITEMTDPAFFDFAQDKPEQTGALALFLATPRADYLKGGLTSINWDLQEMEEHKKEIEDGLLKIKWHPILPASGGSGF
ncbi:short chain dehydrogenase-like protein [Lophiotrema nucula]|uniref:Short chain dehydrogenase-like protein n=1 Tax=Lophiotrema nucula TaxID=690887 RepID=A0A6A5YXA6_9PLEO|nr:short chain dehydrogenase-like protein [Lophiotrema nucula]